MLSRSTLTLRFHKLWRLAAICMIGVGFASPATSADAPDSDLRLVVMVTRHGVRSPLYGDKELGKYAAQPWPQWSVPKGYLTPHGKEQMILMGAYYRALYKAEGLLTGDTTADQAHVFFRTDSDQRTVVTAHDLAAGLLPGAQIDPHARLPIDAIDPMFRAIKLPIGRPDRLLGAAAVLGRLGQDPAALTQACAPEFAMLHRVLFGDSPIAPDKMDVRNLTTAVNPGTDDRTVNVEGSLRTAMQVTDNLMLEYAEGMPMQDVGWGRITPSDLTQLIRLHSLYFGLTNGTFYPAQVQGSNLASHILQTIGQAVSGQANPGAFGSPQHKLIVIVAHDSNIINLAGLMGLEWWLPGTQANPVLPGGALIFELRQRRSDQQFTVRTYYLSQSLAQTRNLDPLTLQKPPGRAPVFIPGCSEATTGFDAPLPRFQSLLHRVIDPAFVLPSPN